MIINVNTMIDLPIEKVWEYWTEPAHIVNWNNASDDWHTTKATNDLRSGGKFSSRMEAKNGSVGFDFSGVHNDVKKYSLIDSVLDDGRLMSVSFKEIDGRTFVSEDFEAEIENSIELQKTGWQAILDNFKKYAEGQGE
ncbi:MAG: hypothetical protein FD141_171 [Fusobacteria bacterium]|nr:MAG: hypothetical protein FD141_171 [Fusobacteriota bacterium]KAF0229165.1 MAG: hypothetical protein FD182_1421 [Fusobacteriota bacterium]